MLHSFAANLQGPRLTSIHHHQCTAGAVAGIEAGTPKRGLEEFEKGKGGSWSQSVSTALCVHLRKAGTQNLVQKQVPTTAEGVLP